MSANRHSSADDLSVDGTVTTGNTSKKLAREVKLEKENAELKAVIYNLRESHNEAIAQLTKRMATQESSYAQELASIKSLLQAMTGMSVS